jgi:hypothetical protein
MERDEIRKKLLSNYLGSMIIDPQEVDSLVNQAVRELDKTSLLKPNMGEVSITVTAGQQYAVIPSSVRILHNLFNGNAEVLKRDYAWCIAAQERGETIDELAYWCYDQIDGTSLTHRILLFSTPATTGTLTARGILWHDEITEENVENYITRKYPETVMKMAASIVEKRFRNHSESAALREDAILDLKSEYFDTIEEELESLPNQMGG